MLSTTLEKIIGDKIFNIIILSGLIILPIVLVYLPADFFDMGQSLCPSKALLDIDCPGCGLTRGVQHTIHFEFAKAWHYNKLIVIIIPILFFYWVKYLIFYYKKLVKK